MSSSCRPCIERLCIVSAQTTLRSNTDDSDKPMSDIEDNPFKGEVSQLDTSLHQEDGDGFDTVDTQVNGEHGQASSEGRPVRESTPQRPTYPMLSSEPKTTFCCSIDRYLHGDEPVITLTNADKTNEGSGSSYVAYSIRTNVGHLSSS